MLKCDPGVAGSSADLSVSCANRFSIARSLIMFTLRRNDISPAITRMIRAASGPQRRAMLRAMGTTFMSITQGNFNQVGASYRPTPWAAKKDGSPATLKKSGLLAQSFHLEVTDSFAKVSNPTVYAATHQFGRDWGRGSRIPARPFFPVLNGKLTPQAERLILSAGRRALERELGK